MTDFVKPVILLFLIVIAAGVSGGCMAADKGRSVVFWCILCTLFPPALLFLYFASQLRDVQGVYRKCPKCGNMIEWRSTTCIYCEVEPK
jgi:hypothetical protein